MWSLSILPSCPSTPSSGSMDLRAFSTCHTGRNASFCSMLSDGSIFVPGSTTGMMT